ncbi:SIMPL domain-containing protein [Flavobacterium sp. CBA20B-1]|uniref:SIMPL domain-containing protein n=1 Tax=unclassified Flavobacterium TaxID=196869 RepID=UPI002225820A|nr:MULTISPECIES: SIMPL domain-containing protein [unclassified Flavobacterium]WCM41080.1 SIMPL domain-containing protein [Flavobacterium sp. CBA20B-1]
MENKSISKAVILSVAIIIGLFSLGFFIFKGLKTFSDKDRVVAVKGLAEMEMKATSAWVTLSFSFSGDDLKGVINQTEVKKNNVIAYLESIGYAKDAIKVNNLNVTDRQTYYSSEWRDGKEVQIKIDRYTAAQSLSIKSNEVEELESKASKIELDLISKDLTSKIYVAYTFPELNTIKPKLIAESTKNARIAGEQFANDSQAQLGKIKTASQGQISIVGNYRYYDGEGAEPSESPKEPYMQKARVVSTIVFFLE